MVTENVMLLKQEWKYVYSEKKMPFVTALSSVIICLRQI